VVIAMLNDDGFQTSENSQTRQHFRHILNFFVKFDTFHAIPVHLSKVRVDVPHFITH
jgi:hypothetical protein